MSGIKGYPTSQKLTNDNQPARNDFATVQPQDIALRAAIDVHARFAHRVGSPTVARTAGVGTGNPSNGSGTEVVDTATPARVGDFVRFEDGNAQYLELPVVAVSTNLIKLGAKLPTANVPASGNTFFIMRYTTQRVDETGSQIVIATPGPTQFVLDGVDVEVEEDSADPTNNKPLPVRLLARAVGFDHIDAFVENILDTAYTELIASVPHATEIEVSNSTGVPLLLALGAAAAEAAFLIVPANGLTRQAVALIAGGRLSVKSLSGDIDAGFVTINLFS